MKPSYTQFDPLKRIASTENQRPTAENKSE